MQKQWINHGRGPGQPDGDDDVINRYGTYEVQANNGTQNDFPQIAQGLSKEETQTLLQKKKNWYHNPSADSQ